MFIYLTPHQSISSTGAETLSCPLLCSLTHSRYSVSIWWMNEFGNDPTQSLPNIMYSINASWMRMKQANLARLPSFEPRFHFPGGSDSKTSAYNVGDPGSIPGLGRSPGEGNGNPLQYSCLENPMDGGAWLATVHGVAKSRIRLSDFTITIIMTSANS